jgi:hypothetical protein
MDCPVKAFFPKYRHSTPSGSKMGMIVNAEKQIEYAILL